MAESITKKREFRMSIDVTITGHNSSQAISELINDALQELVNRRDFRTGAIRQGRAIEYGVDFDAVRVTLDVGIQRIDPN